jgi:enoyl-CoA hydratase/carnithine racemase
MTYQTIAVTRRGAALWIRLDRPQVLNSLSPLMATEINAALDTADTDSELRALVLTGTGRAFCAGADLKEALAMTDGGDADKATAAFTETIRRLADRIERFRLPVIAAVNGLAIAGGMELVLACDLIVAAQSARLGDGHGKFGLMPGGGGSVRLPRKIGPMRAKYLMFTAEYLPARTLMEWGLVTEVVADDGLETGVDALVAKLADKSPLGLARLKQLVDDGLDQPVEVAMRAEQLMSSLHNHSHDRAEGLAAFNEKRTPKFTGR